MITLRDYQETAVQDVRIAYREKYRSVILVLSTGAGKTIIFSYIARSAAEKGKRVLILAHRDALIKQASSKLHDYDVPHGIIMAGFTPNPRARVQVGSVQTLTRRLDKITFEPDLIIIDECLHGDTLIDTDIGTIKISDVPIFNPIMVRSFDGCKDVWMKISAFADKGVRNTLRVTYPGGGITCTGNHLFFTRSGWKRADQLTTNDQVFVPADAEAKLRLISGDISQNGCRDTGNTHQGKSSTGISVTRTSLLTGQSAHAGVESLPSQSSKAQMKCAGTGLSAEDTVNTCSVTSQDVPISSPLLERSKFRLYTVHCLVIALLASRIRRLKTHDWLGITALSKRPGPIIKPSSLADWPSGSSFPKTKVTASYLLEALRHAIHCCSKSLKFALQAGQSGSLQIGLAGSDLSVSPGGTATMATSEPMQKSHFSMLKGLMQNHKKRPGTGLMLDLAGPHFRQMEEDAESSGYMSGQHGDCSTKYGATSRTFLPTSWLPVLSVREDSESRVFDIQVDQTECFYASGVLVHNCHLSAAKSYKDIVARYPNALILGVTGSPCRLDNKPLGREFGGLYDYMVTGISIRQLIARGFLVKPVVYAPLEQLDLSGVRKTAGEHNTADLVAVVDKPKITGSAVAHYKRICPNAPAIAWCVTVEHANHVADEFNAAGIKAVMLCGEHDGAYRDKIGKQLQSGEINVVTFVGILIEGVDWPAIACIIMLRPTLSLSSYLQVIGRGLRPMPGKTCCYVLDHGGLTFKHGLADEERDWSLDWGEKKKAGKGKKKEDIVDVLQCKKCWGVFTPADICPHCGAPVEGRSRKIEHADGELGVITDEMAELMRRQKKREVGSARTLEELEKIGAQRGYKPTWAKYVFESRNKKTMKSIGHDPQFADWLSQNLAK